MIRYLKIGLLLVLTGVSLRAEVTEDVKGAYLRYWEVLRVSLDGYFVPENGMLRLQLANGRDLTVDEAKRKKSEVFALTELLLFSDWKNLKERPVGEIRKKLEQDIFYISAISLWGISGSSSEQQLRLYTAYSRLLRDIETIRRSHGI